MDNTININSDIKSASRTLNSSSLNDKSPTQHNPFELGETLEGTNIRGSLKDLFYLISLTLTNTK